MKVPQIVMKIFCFVGLFFSFFFCESIAGAEQSDIARINPVKTSVEVIRSKNRINSAGIFISLDNKDKSEKRKFSYSIETHPETGWSYIYLQCIDSEASAECASAKISPEMGSNLFSFQVSGIEYIYGFRNTPGGENLLGSPVLYPTPNRVRDAQFIFEGRTFSFKPNSGKNFIHGLVRNSVWTYDEPVITEESVSVTTRISITPGTESFEFFPIKNTLELTYTLYDHSIRLDFIIRNDDEEDVLPVGLAIHPYFPIFGSREDVRIQVPAKKWMEAVSLLPTGRLIDLAESERDLRTPTSLNVLDLDDVFWGMQEEKPAIIYYDSIKKIVTLKASELFTHCVVYTPPGASFFCIENQSCSTDAHNLFLKGFEKEAHLSIIKPGDSLKSWIEISVADQ